MKNVVLGASGMLGAMVYDVLSRSDLGPVAGTVRDPALAKSMEASYPDGAFQLLDVESTDVDELSELLEGTAWVVNAIGVIKPYIRDDRRAEVLRAIRVNGEFPHLLAEAAARTGARVIQIATDCVYSGLKGSYTEKDPHDALDVYGKTKSLGEVLHPQVQHLRCSIIGPEPKAHVSLLDWFRGQPKGGGVNGFVNHQWNGVTTYHFGRLCAGIIARGISWEGVQHVLPSDRLSKYELLGQFRDIYDRKDITIKPTEAATVINRILETVEPKRNAEAWSAAGYATPPRVADMVREMAAYDHAFDEVTQ